MDRLILPVQNWSQHRTGECLAACAAMVLEYAEAPIRVLRGDFDLAWLEHDEKYAVITR